MAEVRRRPVAPGSFALLIRLNSMRLLASLRRPGMGTVTIVLVPALLLALLTVVGPQVFAGVPAAHRMVTASLILAGVQAFAAYGVLFRGADTAFLRRTGQAGAGLMQERATRLLLAGLAVAVLIWIPAAHGIEKLETLVSLVTIAVVCWAVSLSGMAWAARAMALTERPRSLGCLGVGMWDREVAAAAPLVYAPVLPMLVAPLAVVFLLVTPIPFSIRALILIAIAIGVGWLAVSGIAGTLGRFLPQVFEMSFAAVPDTGHERLIVGKGVSRILPARISAMWARDTAIAGRSYAWAARLVWPVAVIGFFALGRWGDLPATRAWVIATTVAVLLIQAASVVLLGRRERGATRWIDRSIGASQGQRLAARWLWGTGMSLWLTIPIALAWHWWSGADHAWAWIAAGALTSLGAASTSTLLAGR